MNLAKINNGTIVEYPLTSESYQEAVTAGFNLAMTAGELADIGLVNVVLQPRPTDAYDYQEQAPQLIDGQWQTTWQKDLTTDQTVMAVRRDNVARSHRRTRDQLIKECQWRFERHARLARLNQTQVDDIAVLDAYVQALADVPEQAGWPFDITWPTRP